jgi:hypothetical protein
LSNVNVEHDYLIIHELATDIRFNYVPGENADYFMAACANFTGASSFIW